ncbi:ATP-binding protein [Sulfuricurvum sp.]|uniref:ATP-binding protein n=1 Tax=Sulfuricurvum sp. TaxID=2025608 RepID=UPI002639D1BA|nr:ATP-binding protein [Sulfuricurvum sp.]MDD3597558.1 ATP-binding protein [Sulfuricurvum sp.]
MTPQSELEKAFGKIAIEQIKSNIERIISSYRHPWDIFTELIQNSTDAIVDEFGYENIEKGIIELSILPNDRILSIKDNGCGISDNYLSSVLVVGESLKRKNDSGRYGFMGFGLSFVAFQSKKFVIESFVNGTYSKRTYHDLYKFIYTNENIALISEEEINQTNVPELSDHDNGTVITITFPDEIPNEAREDDLKMAFKYAEKPQLIETILKTRTSVGTLDFIFGSKKHFNFFLTIDDETRIVQAGYLTHREIIKTLIPHEDRLYDIESEFSPLVKVTERLPLRQQNEARRVVLLDTAIENVQIGARNSLNARLYLIATSKDHLNDYNRKILEIDDRDKDNNSFFIENGLWLAIDGMPTGIRLDSYEHSKDLPFTAIIDVQDKRIRNDLDAGRKGISEYRKLQIINLVKQEFRKHNFYKYRQYVVGSYSRISDPLSDPKRGLREKFEQKECYHIPLTQQYFPPIEEQEVISLFTELCATGILKGYYLKALSGYEIYDGFYKYYLDYDPNVLLTNENTFGVHENTFARYGDSIQKDDVVIEYKTNLEMIYDNLHRNQKDLNHIDILVCWNIKSSDNEINDNGDILRTVDSYEKIYYGVTHELITGRRQQALPIIELRTIINTVFQLTI